MEKDNDLAMGYVMGRDNGYANNGMFGNDWWAIIIILALLGNGNGFFGNGGGNNVGYELGKIATTNDVASGFSTSAIMSDLNDLLLGQTQGFANVQQTMCQGFNGLQQTVMQGFHGVDNAVCTLGYNMQSGFNSLGHQISDCCCTTQRAIDSVKYENQKNTCDIIRAGQDNTREILNYLVSQETQRLRDENQTLKFAASQANQNAFIAATQDAQTAELIRRLGRDNPVPAYVVPNPYCCNNNCCGF